MRIPNCRTLGTNNQYYKILKTYSELRKTYGAVKIVRFEGSLEVKLPTLWTDEKQSREEAERRERLEERRVEEKE